MLLTAPAANVVTPATDRLPLSLIAPFDVSDKPPLIDDVPKSRLSVSRSDTLLAEYGVYVQPINYPTVPRGTERLRFTPGPQHDEDMMRELTGALVEIWDRMEMRVAEAA